MDVLDPATVDAALAEGMAWEREGGELVKVHTGRDFADALAYVERRRRPGRADGSPSRHRHPLEQRDTSTVDALGRRHHRGRSGTGPPDRRPAGLTACDPSSALTPHRRTAPGATRVEVPLRPGSSPGRSAPRDRSTAPARGATVYTLSHWPGTPTPPGLEGDLSAEIVRHGLRQPGLLPPEVEVASIDHYDVDGVVALGLVVLDGLDDDSWTAAGGGGPGGRLRRRDRPPRRARSPSP